MTPPSTLFYGGHADGRIPVSNGLSDRISRDLKKRGFPSIGPVTIYAHLQTCGVVNDHAGDCPCYKRIHASFPAVKSQPDQEAGQICGNRNDQDPGKPAQSAEKRITALKRIKMLLHVFGPNGICKIPHELIPVRQVSLVPKNRISTRFLFSVLQQKIL